MVSVIIPVYNNKDYIKNALLSLRKQTYKNLDIIVINDGSTDGLDFDYIKNIIPNVRYYNKQNEGLGLTRNLGIELAKGNYIFFLDADDTLPPNAIKILRDTINDMDFIIGQCKKIYFNKNNKIYKEVIWKKQLEKQKVNKYNFIIDTIATNKLYKKDFLIQKKIKFQTDLYEDKLFVLKVLESSKKFKYVNKVIYNWHVHYDSRSITNTLNISNLKERMKVIYSCINYTNDERLKKIIIYNTIKHDLKLYINRFNQYSFKEKEEFYNIYKNFYYKYKNYINDNEYFVDKIIITNINNKNLIFNEFELISVENNTRNFFIKFKKYLRYSLFYIKKKIK